jgi:GntR family transcriptional regulator
MIEFHLDRSRGTSPYVQLVQQVMQALRLGLLRPGDRLPTAAEVVAMLAINPNTVFKAYRELERDGLVVLRPGQGTFVLASLANPALADAGLRDELAAWAGRARRAGLSAEDVMALCSDVMAACFTEGAA